jgi:hypothetical protein
MRTLRKKNELHLTYELRLWARDRIAVATTGYREGGIRVDFGRLDDDETRELIGLVQSAGTEVTYTGGGYRPDLGGDGMLKIVDGAKPGINLLQLGDRLDRFEALVEQAAGVEQGSIFQAARARAELAAMGADVRRDRQKLGRRAKLEEEGSITIPREWIFDDVRSGHLWPSHIALLAYLMACWENGDLAVRNPAVSYDGTWISIDFRRAGGLLPDPEMEVNEQHLLDHLHASGLVVIVKTGKLWKVGRGERYLSQFRRAA